MNVHRLSGPTPGQVALQVGPVFTCLLSQVAQTPAPFWSSGAWGRPWCAVRSQLLTSPHRGFTPPVGGGVRSKQQQTRQKRYFGKVRRGPCTPHYWNTDSVGLWMKWACWGGIELSPPPLYLGSVIQGHLGGTLLTSFPFQASESLLDRCVLQRSLGQEKSKWEVLGGQL